MATASENTGLAGQEDKPLAEEPADLEARVRVRQFAAVSGRGRISNLASPVIAAIVCLVLWREVSGSHLATWLTCVVLASFVRGVTYYRVDRSALERNRVTLAARLCFLATTFLGGLAWGGGMPFFLPVVDFTLQAFLIVVILGVGAGVTASLGPCFPALAAYVTPLTIPIATILLAQQTQMHTALGIFGYIFLAVLLSLGLVAHRNFALNVRLEFETGYLARDLERTQQRLGEAIDSLSEAFALFDAKGRLVLTNKRLRELVPDLSKQGNADVPYEAFVRQFAEAGLGDVPAEKVDAWIENFMQLRQTSGASFEVEVGKDQWLQVGERPTGDGGVVSIFTDLSQLKSRESVLLQSEQRFRDFTEAASDWIFELDADLRFMFVGAGYAEVSGYKPEDLIGTKVTDLPSLDADPGARAVREAFLEGRPFHNRQIGRPNAKGQPFYVLGSGIPVYSDDGEFAGFRATGSDITAVVNAEERAREAQNRLFDAIEAIPAAFILFDKEDRMVLWNSNTPNIMEADSRLIRAGTPYEELVRSSAASGKVADVEDDAEAWIDQHLRWFEEPEHAIEILLADGRFLQKQGRRTADGGAVFIMTDITAVRHDQLELSEKTSLLQATLEGMGEGILVLDRTQCVTLANNRLLQLLGLPTGATVVGLQFSEIARQIEPVGGSPEIEGEGISQPTLDEFFAAGVAFQVERARLPDIRLLMRANPLDDGGWVLLLTDVTVERTAIAALEDSEERYRQLVENSPDMISIHQGGRFVFLNPAAATFIGVDAADELIGRRVLEFVHDDYHDMLRLSEPTVQAYGHDGPFFEFLGLRSDGEEFAAEGVSIEFVYRGRPAILSIVRDMTIRKLAEAQLVQTSKLATLGELAAGITHELNQPLNVIRMAADSSLILMEDGQTDREFERKQFERISDHAVRMANIISHMGTFSRREDGDRDRELFDPLDSVHAAVSLVRDLYVAQNVFIDVQSSGGVNLVHGNRIRLEQVILNLLTNSHDAVVLETVDPETGRSFRRQQLGQIQVSVRSEIRDVDDPDGHYGDVVIRIDDNGGGIPVNSVERVFDPFYTTKRTGQGTGLGLAIGYNIVDSMGGYIAASNEPDGARFEIWLPVANEHDLGAGVSAQSIQTDERAEHDHELGKG